MMSMDELKIDRMYITEKCDKTSSKDSIGTHNFIKIRLLGRNNFNNQYINYIFPETHLINYFPCFYD